MPFSFRRLVGKRIRVFRNAKGWSQEQLGEYASLSYKFIGEIERGTVNPSLDTILGISNALSVEIAKLFSSDQLLVLKEDDISSIQSALATLNEILENRRPS